MSSSAGPSRVSRPRRSRAATSNGKALSSTGTGDGARIGASGAVFVSGDWETMGAYLGSFVTKRKGGFCRPGLVRNCARGPGSYHGSQLLDRATTTSFKRIDHAV